MTTIRRVARCAAGVALGVLIFVSRASAQEYLLVACEDPNRCTFRPASMPTVNGADRVRIVPSGGDAPSKGRIVKLSTLSGMYLEAATGAMRELRSEGEIDRRENILPVKLPKGTADGPQAPWTLEFRDQPRAKTRTAVSGQQFVALIRGPNLDRVAIDFIKRETLAAHAHPKRAQLVTGALLFSARSEELARWREDLVQRMRGSLETFRAETVDPAKMEATLAEGFAAIPIFRQIAPDARQDALIEDLAAEHNRLRERFEIARVLRSSQMHDAFIAKLDQIGLARWSRPELLDSVSQVLEASAKLHQTRASELYKARQFVGAFDEAAIANNRLPCNDTARDLYYQARVYYVNQNKIPTRAEYESDNLSMLQQIVRELQGMAQELKLTPEQIDHFRKRIAEGERRGRDYLPLQLKKAEFLASIGELSEARDVVTQVERSVSLGRTEADEWLQMDASLNTKLVILRQEVDRLAIQQMTNGEFKEALATAMRGLAAEPQNPRFLYLGAVASAVLRDYDKTRQYVQRYLRQSVGDCANGKEATATMFDLYRRQAPETGPLAPGDRTPNWISGALYPAGEVSYDVVSGSFNPRIGSSTIIDKQATLATHFVWEGYLASAIRTTIGTYSGDRQAQLELEPTYEQKRVYMNGIGSRASSTGQRRSMPLRYVNSPDYDPTLASKFTKKVSTRGWAGNPFFHPFLWSDIFVFDLEYDELGRLRYATPDNSDPSRPVSPFSERLTFSWDGSSRRLLSVAGTRYRRELVYDERGLLIQEKITHPLGKGRITYSYKGKPAQLVEILCEDDFYDRAHRRVTTAPLNR